MVWSRNFSKLEFYLIPGELVPKKIYLLNGYGLQIDECKNNIII